MSLSISDDAVLVDLIYSSVTEDLGSDIPDAADADVVSIDYFFYFGPVLFQRFGLVF